jgi:hypothetical protein
MVLAGQFIKATVEEDDVIQGCQLLLASPNWLGRSFDILTAVWIQSPAFLTV